MNRELLRASIERAVRFEFSRSGGPGGQNVNKVNSKVLARMPLDAIEGLSEAERAHVALVLSARVVSNEIMVASESERTQEANRRIALSRLEALIVKAAHIPKRRIATKPSRAARERRLSGKRARASIKRDRGAGKLDEQ